ncbi:unnamed protein product [Phytophthora fragariaefolia]|uniref:Unnamed protein product n=1 Tax=Phytophthora fragariaefolia TaxID=1490495 RepID=A0A9W6XQ58_9STRA|nr:unnamed protein product [Phytophthora fragariaefolia]
MKALGMQGLERATLRNHENYEAFKSYAKNLDANWLEVDTTTSQAWKEPGFGTFMARLAYLTVSCSPLENTRLSFGMTGVCL